MTCPDTKPASSPVKNAMALAMSSGCPTRCTGICVAAAAWNSSKPMPTRAAVAQRRGGGERDDAAELGLDHVRLDGLGHQERALEVDVHHEVPVGLAHLEEQVVAEHARVVDEDRRCAELGGHPRHGGLHLGTVRHIAADGEGLAPGGGDLLDRVLARRLVEVEYGDGAALGRQAYGGGGADAPCRSRHDGDALLGGGHAWFSSPLDRGSADVRKFPITEQPLSTFSRRDARSPGTRCQRHTGARAHVTPDGAVAAYVTDGAAGAGISAPAGRADARSRLPGPG